MQGTTSEYMEQARILTDTKRRVVESLLNSGRGAEMSTVAVQRKAATLFYSLVTESIRLNKASTRQLVGIYERFGESELLAA